METLEVDSKSTQDQDRKDQCEEAVTASVEYRAYLSRWFVLISVLLVTIANNVLWISFAAVNTYAADYYDKDPTEIDYFSMISLIIGMPLCFASTFIVDRLGLRTGVLFAATTTFLGGLLRCLSTFPGLRNHMSLDLQFWLGVAGQGITGMGNPIAVSLPTKVSQHWFPVNEVGLATGILAIALPIGIAMGYGGTTIFVTSAGDIPLMNWVWFIPAAVTFVFVLFGMRSSKPPTPPSKSAAFDQLSISYWQSLRSLFTNPQFWVLMFCLGGAIGFINAFLTLLQNMMCSRGYENWFSGLCGSLLLCTGGIGALSGGWVVQKTGRMEETAKAMLAIAVCLGIGIAEVIRKSDLDGALVTLCALFGIFAFGFYPLGLELAVEVIYPIDEASGTVMIFLSGQIQGVLLVVLSDVFAQDLKPAALEKELCTELGNGDEYFAGVDHTRFLLFICGYMAAIAVIFIAVFRSSYRRRAANA